VQFVGHILLSSTQKILKKLKDKIKNKNKTANNNENYKYKTHTQIYFRKCVGYSEFERLSYASSGK